MFNDLKEFYKYPAVITCGDEDNNLYDIEFVDFEGLVLYGKKEGEIEILASKFLQETIISYLDKGRELPQASQGL